jgi:RsiW-degrading membrane proteinase PrsW (M82 family)
MQTLKTAGKPLLVVVLALVGLALLASLPYALYSLLFFIFREVSLLTFVPGMLLYLFLFCVPLGLIQWRRWADRHPSESLRLPPAALLAGVAVAAILVGQLFKAGGVAPLFWPCFLLAAGLPPLVALAFASQRLGHVTTWRRALAGLLAGSLLSTHLTILLSAGVGLLAYTLVLPLRQLMAELIASKSLERMFFSPALVGTLIGMAIVAPVVEELAKLLGAILLARRLRGPAEAFLVGMAGGVGFATLENMLYESSSPERWAHISLLRGMGGVLHPLNAGLVAVGWYGVRNGLPGAQRRLLGYYGLAVGAHALWNGGLTVLLFGFGSYFFGADTWKLTLYSIGQPGIVIVFLLLETIALWRLLMIVTDCLRDPLATSVESGLALQLDQPRRLALWAVGLLAVLVSIGAIYGPLLARYSSRLVPVS